MNDTPWSPADELLKQFIESEYYSGLLDVLDRSQAEQFIRDINALLRDFAP